MDVGIWDKAPKINKTGRRNGFIPALHRLDFRFHRLGISRLWSQASQYDGVVGWCRSLCLSLFCQQHFDVDCHWRGTCAPAFCNPAVIGRPSFANARIFPRAREGNTEKDKSQRCSSFFLSVLQMRLFSLALIFLIYENYFTMRSMLPPCPF